MTVEWYYIPVILALMVLVVYLVIQDVKKKQAYLDKEFGELIEMHWNDVMGENSKSNNTTI